MGSSGPEATEERMDVPWDTEATPHRTQRGPSLLLQTDSFSFYHFFSIFPNHAAFFFRVMAGPPSDFQMTAGLLLVARVGMSVSVALFTFCVFFDSRTKSIASELASTQGPAKHNPPPKHVTSSESSSTICPIQGRFRKERCLSSELEASKKWN